MVDLAKTLNNDADMIRLAQIFVQQPRNTVRSPISFRSFINIYYAFINQSSNFDHHLSILRLSLPAPIFSLTGHRSLIARKRRGTQSSMASSTANSRVPISPSSVGTRLATCLLVSPPWSHRVHVLPATRLYPMAYDSTRSSRLPERRSGECLSMHLFGTPAWVLIGRAVAET
jgi:hypothetical protein